MKKTTLLMFLINVSLAFSQEVKPPKTDEELKKVEQLQEVQIVGSRNT